MPRRRNYTIKVKQDKWFGKILVFRPEDTTVWPTIVRRRSATGTTFWPFKTTRGKK